MVSTIYATINYLLMELIDDIHDFWETGRSLGCKSMYCTKIGTSRVVRFSKPLQHEPGATVHQ